ncbi:MAG TPA: hypothetical protein VEW42_06130 [Candidatus Eisenbacteria bacterium]|nr:hypothetical protein [Candidatus Eisenbacteria bacterium]
MKRERVGVVPRRSRKERWSQAVDTIFEKGERVLELLDRPGPQSTPKEDAALVRQMTMETAEYLLTAQGVSSELRDLAQKKLQQLAPETVKEKG